jgi:hypothetical protein
MPWDGKGVFVGAARFLGHEHGQALVAGLVRVGAGEHVMMSARTGWVIQVLLPVMV